MFDGVISDESSLHSATLCSKEEFQYILERAGACAIASGDMLLFRDDESRTSDPGNRCKLRFRHALFMSLIRKKDNPTQGTLQAIFGVDQTSVCRYLKVMDRILASVLPAAKNVSKEIAACKTKEEFKRIVPRPGGGDVTADGTHCPAQRPSEKTVRRMIYSGKKKRFTYNTNVYTDADGVVIEISRRSVGSAGDITLLREDPMPFGRWTESMRYGSTPEEDRIRVWVDRGYQGTNRDLPGATFMIPHKRSKNHRILTSEQKEHNHLFNSTRVRVEHSIGRLKRYARLADPYDGTISQFNHEFNVITGLVSLHLRHDPQLKIKSFSSNSYRGVFPNKQILHDYAESCAILCPSANYESSLCSGIRSTRARRHLAGGGHRLTVAGPSLLQAAPRSDGRARAHCSAARVRTSCYESLKNSSCVMRPGAKLIHKSSNSSGTLPRIENYAELRIESIGCNIIY